jgi:predicted GNAT family acetyltransferase
MSKPFVWRKVGKIATPGNAKRLAKSADFLKKRERYCVAICARFLYRRGSQEHLWFLPDEQGRAAAVLLHSKRSLFPVFDGKEETPIPRFMQRFLSKIAIHAVQGLRKDVEILDAAIHDLGYTPPEIIDYDLMALDREMAYVKKDLAGLIVREPIPAEIDDIFPLQAAYEQEEVLPSGSEFIPASCRMNLEQIMKKERMLIACYKGRIIGKINTSAASFTRYQIGGVYVHPDYRGRGIAQCMIRAFIRLLVPQGRGLSLFVKKRNQAAHAVYSRAGFQTIGDYRISYY